MSNFDMLKTADDYNVCMNIVEQFREYCFSLMSINQILPTTYTKLEAAAYTLTGRLLNKLIDLTVGDIVISEENIQIVVQSANVDNPVKEIVKPVIDDYAGMIMGYASAVLRRKTHEIVETDVDTILKAIDILEEKYKVAKR